MEELLSWSRSRACRTFLIFVLTCTVIVFSGCAGHTPAGKVAISAENLSLTAGTSTQLKAIDTSFRDQTIDITRTAIWVSSDTAVATVSSTGLLTAVAAGTAVITATASNHDAGSLSMVIGAPLLSGISVTPASSSLAQGQTQQYTATATYANGTSSNISSSVTWSISPASVATVSSTGLVSSVSVGSFVVTANSGSFIATAPGTVGPAALTSLSISPANISLAGGSTQQFAAVGTYSDQTTRDVTNFVTWSSSNLNLLSISSSGLGTSLGGANVSVNVTAASGAVSASVPAIITPGAAMTKLEVEPTSSSIATGSAEQHTATAFYADGTQKDVTRLVTWSTVTTSPQEAARHGEIHDRAVVRPRDSNSVSVSPTGVDTAGDPGMASVSASMGSMQSDSVVIVTAATPLSLSITASKQLFPVGASQPIQLTGVFSDGSTQDLSLTANWNSSNASIATIDATGVAIGVAPGPVVFSASFKGLSASTTGYQVTPASLVSTTLAALYPADLTGLTQPLKVYGTYADGSTYDVTSLASFSSANPNVFAVDDSGLAYGTSTGSTQITAKVGEHSSIGEFASFTDPLLSVQVISPVNRIAIGTHFPLTALAQSTNGFGIDVSYPSIWTSADPTVLTVDGSGRLKSGKVGQTTVSATVLGVTGTSQPIQVTGATVTALLVADAQLSTESSTIAAQTSKQYTAVAFFSDNSTQDVTDDVTWDTSDHTVASVDLDGTVSGITPGQVQVTASLMGQTASIPLSISNATLVSTALSPGDPELPVGIYRQFALIGTFSDGSTQDLSLDSIFQSTVPTIASLVPQGIGLGVGAGVGQITAQRGYFTASTPVNVTPVGLTAISLTPSTTIRLGQDLLLTATGTFSDGYSQELLDSVLFASSNPDLVPVRQTGLAVGTGVGTAIVSATLRGITATSTVTVLSNVLTSIALSPANPSLIAGTSQQFTATGTYDDGSIGDVTKTVIWTSANPAVLTVSPSGLATVLSSANAQVIVVTAKSGTIQQSFSVIVASGPANTPTLTGVAITPLNASFMVGGNLQFALTASYSDGTTQDVTHAAVWTSSNPATATVGAGTGLAHGVAGGTVLFTASYLGEIVSSSPETVTPATLVSIAVTPADAGLMKGANLQFMVIGTYSDGTTQNLTSSATYISSNPTVLAVSASGQATGLGVGSASLMVAAGGITFTTPTILVTPAILQSIVVTPTSSRIAAGTTQALLVTGTYSDGTTQNLTASAAWASNAAAVATVNAQGVVNAVAIGQAAIQASQGGFTSSAVVLVSAATLQSLAINPSGASFAAGNTQQFSVIGTFSDGSTQDLTSASTWSSTNSAAALIDANGLAAGLAPGVVQFTASYSGQTVTSAASSVTAASLVSITVAPSSLSFAKGTSQQFTVTGDYSDGTTHDLTNSASYATSDPAVVTISPTGLVMGAGNGAAQVTIISGGQTANAQVTITPAVLLSIAITPTNPTFGAGMRQQFTATGTFSDGTTQDLSSAAIWVSSNPQVLTIDSAGDAQSSSAGSVSVTASIDGIMTTTAPFAVTPAVLVQLLLTPASTQIAKGSSVQLTATGVYTDGTSENLSTQATWTSSNGSIAGVDATGLATGFAVGSAQMSATYQGQTTSTSSFTVTAATLVSLVFSPASPSVASGSSAQLTVTGTYSDGTTQNLTSAATFSSSTSNVSVSTTGLITGNTPGSAVITVTVDGQTSSFPVTVSNATLLSLTISPTPAPDFAKGTSQQFTAKGTYSDGTTQNLSSLVAWSSSAASVAIIDSNGLATGLGQGSASISVSYQGQTAASAPFTILPAVLSSIAISPTVASVGTTGTIAFTATGTYSDATTQNLTAQVTWSSSNNLLAIVSASGVATGLLPGTVTITAALGAQTGTSKLTVVLGAAPATLSTINVTPSSATIVAGTTQQYTATGTFSDGTTKNVTSTATWSSNTGNATITSSGVATGVTAGNATIRAVQSGINSNPVSVVVTAAPVTLSSIAIAPTAPTVPLAGAQQLAATGTYSDGSTADITLQVTWTSSDPTIASISASGVANGLRAGNTQITAALASRSATITLSVSPATLSSLNVNPSNPSIANGTTQQFKASGTFSDGSTQDLSNSVTWTSSNHTVATITAAGLASSAATGPVTITAQSGTLSATATLTITAAAPVSLQISPASISLSAGSTQQLLVTATFTDGTSQDVTRSVTYSSSHAPIATVTSSGSLSAVSQGSTVITTTLDGISAALPVSVTAASLTSIVLTPSAPSIPAGLTQQFTATGAYSDGSTSDLTGSVNWTSSTPSVLAINAAGNATAASLGNATVTASYAGVSGSDPATVIAAIATAVSVSPTPVTLAAGQTQQFAATATFSDGTQQNATATAHWSVGDPTRATISNTNGNSGLLTANAAGSTSAMATVGSASGSASVTITAATISSLTINPGALNSIPAGTTKVLTVTAAYSDGSNADVTNQVTWTTGSASTAYVDPTGLLHAVAPGLTTIDAHLGGVDGTSAVLVSNATLASIAITPVSTTLAVGQVVQLAATGTYSDGSTTILTTQVQWSSSSIATATISSSGMVTSLAPGSSTLAATLNGVSGNTLLSVTSATLQSIAVTSVQSSFALGQSIQLKATGTYSNGTTQDLTSTVIWSSDTPATGVVSSTGVATGVHAGSFNARAVSNGVTGTETISVTSATLVSIAVTPTGQVIVDLGNNTVQFVATGTFSDGTTQNLGSSVHWSTTGIVVGSISAAGIFSPTGIGLGTVVATSGGISGSTTLTVVAL